VAVLLAVGDGSGQGEVERRLDAFFLEIVSFQDGQQELKGGSLGEGERGRPCRAQEVCGGLVERHRLVRAHG
jgi:hypothetical protein